MLMKRREKQNGFSGEIDDGLKENMRMGPRLPTGRAVIPSKERAVARAE